VETEKYGLTHLLIERKMKINKAARDFCPFEGCKNKKYGECFEIRKLK
jgi:hypothetical protein